MTDVRAILETEAHSRARRDRLVKGFAKFLMVVTVISVLVGIARHRSGWDLFVDLAPLATLATAAAGYSPKHRKALAEAIADPDPALDGHFAGTLASFDPAVFALGQEAFVQRFSHRVPSLKPSEWRTVALSLLQTREKNAALMLSLLRQGAGASAIEATEAFATATKTDRLRTAAREALGEIRLRTARETVLTRVQTVEQAHAAEVVRLGLR